jgi:GNAT superfamily N-acetyltransferase
VTPAPEPDVVLQPVTAPPPGAAGLCYPRILGDWAGGAPFAGIAAYDGTALSGLAVCGPPYDDGAGTRTVRLLSLAVRRELRRRGIARRLVDAAVVQAAAAGARRIVAFTSTRTRAHPIVVRLLVAAGWSAPALLEHRIAGTCSAALRAAERATRAREALCRRGFSSRPWSAVTPADEAQIRALVASGEVPASCDPLRAARDHDPELSVVLCADGAVAGWIHAKRQPGATSVFYSDGWVRAPYQRMGWLLGGLFDVVAGQARLLGPETLAVYATDASNAPMIAFMRRRLGPLCRWTDTRYRLVRELDPNA